MTRFKWWLWCGVLGFVLIFLFMLRKTRPAKLLAYQLRIRERESRARIEDLEAAKAKRKAEIAGSWSVADRHRKEAELAARRAESARKEIENVKREVRQTLDPHDRARRFNARRARERGGPGPR